MSFIKVADVGDIPAGHGSLVDANGVSIAVFNQGGGRFFAVSPVCPHEDGPLAEGWLEGDAVVCPWHGFDFDLRTGRCGVDADLAVTVYAVRLNGSAIEVDLP
jgi:nitrite reductase (NADH) small subunit